MELKRFAYLFIIISLLFQGCKNDSLVENTALTFDESKPWVYWFLTDASISEKGITTDLEAMKENGIGGAYLFTIRGALNPSLYEPTVVQLTPEWWEMMKFAVSEADRLGLKLGIHACDGFTAAGGPWITPDISMQKVVWSDTLVSGGQKFECFLPQPEAVEDYYEDIATFAFPASKGWGSSSYKTIPKVSSSIPGTDPSFLTLKGNKRNFTSREKCWIQYEFQEPFTCRSISLQSGWNNFQANRLIIQTSNDGKIFQSHGRLNAYRHGWDDRDVTSTHLFEPLTAKYYRFVFDPEGSEPGAEDLDDAKWRSRLSVSGIELSGEAKIHQFEAKSGAVWRIASSSNDEYLSEMDIVDPETMIDITGYKDEDGQLTWDVPEGSWVILRMGHTSTGATNYIGGGGVGLECDKLNPKAVKIQFENWFEAIYDYAGEELSKNVIEELYNDSWECGSQNWSPVFLEEFRERKGYDLTPYLPVMAGVPIQSIDQSEQVLHDIRECISELLVDSYHGTMKSLAHEKGCRYSSECVAPVFMSDGMLHYKNADAPTGEFWFRSPSHDKPNDILDAVSGAHVYGKTLVRAEAGTEIRIDWDEHPALIKSLFDRNFALGINKMIFHVFAHDPWTDRKPGKTVGVVGVFFQPRQTWWEPGKAWIKYIENCQTILQQGVPVADIAVFTGEEVPRRAVLPDRLVPVLPGIFGEEKVESELIRLKNDGLQTREKPRDLITQVNMSDPLDWIDPLKGYAYDSFNKDVLLNRAKVVNGRIELPGGASYGLLIIPGKRRMDPEAKMSLEVASQILRLVKDGAMVYFQEKPSGCFNEAKDKEAFDAVFDELFSDQEPEKLAESLYAYKTGKGSVLHGEFSLSSFETLEIPKDFFARTSENEYADKIAWTHRSTEEEEIFFLSNQKEELRELELSFRVSGKEPEIYNPVTGETKKCAQWQSENERTIVPLRFDSNESLFVIFRSETTAKGVDEGNNYPEFEEKELISENWQLEFDPAFGGPEELVEFHKLEDWSKSGNEKIKYYSGTAVYHKTFEWNGDSEALWLDVGEVYNLAEVRVNGENCGVAWTAPYRVDISKALKKGTNEIEIAVTNTWANRVMGDHPLPEEERITWSTCAYRLEGKDLLPAGLLGPVRLLEEKK